jgi:hypothetical protein
MLRRAFLQGAAVMPFGTSRGQGFNNPVLSSFAAGNVTLTKNGLVVYSGTPGANNVLYSVAPAGYTDKYGNVILLGETDYYKAGAVYWAAETISNSTLFWSSATGQNGWTAQGAFEYAQTTTNNFVVFPPTGSGFSSAGLDGSGFLTLVNSAGLVSQFSPNVNGNPQANDSSGFAGILPLVQSDVTPLSNANQVGPNRISAIYTIPAGDLNPTTHYWVEMPFAAMMESQTLELGLSIDGIAAYTCNVIIGGAIVGAGVGLTGTLRVHLRCVTNGVAGTIDAWTDGTVNQTSANVLFTNSGGLTGNEANGVALNTTIAHTIRVNSTWGAAAAGQVVSTLGSDCYRIGA